MNEKIRNILLTTSALFILAGAGLYLLHLPFTVYIFAIGAIGMATARITSHYNGSNFRLKRLYRIETIAAFITIGSAWFMFKNQILATLYFIHDSQSRKKREINIPVNYNGNKHKKNEVPSELRFFILNTENYSATTSKGISTLTSL